MRQKWWRTLTILAGSGIIVGSVLTGPAAQAKATQIVNNGSGKCLDMPNGGIGTVAIQFTCNSSDPFEFWTLVPVCTSQFGCSDQYLIKNLDTSFCLAPSTTGVPTTVAQSVCNTSGGNLAQVWRKLPSSSSPFELENDLDRADMHPQSNANTNGTPIYVNFATGDSHYLWHLA